MKNENTMFGCFGMIALVIITVVLSSVVNGWALTILWRWFVMPIFENVPALTTPAAIGLGMVVSYLTREWGDSDNKEDKRDMGEKIIYVTLMSLAKPSMTLAFGWVVYQFI